MLNDLEEVLKDYRTKKVINYSNYFSGYDFEKLKKLGIYIDPDKIYTEEEHELFEMELIEYWDGAERVDGTLEPPMKQLEGTGVTREEYNELLKKMNEVKTQYT